MIGYEFVKKSVFVSISDSASLTLQRKHPRVEYLIKNVYCVCMVSHLLVTPTQDNWASVETTRIKCTVSNDENSRPYEIIISKNKQLNQVYDLTASANSGPFHPVYHRLSIDLTPVD